MARPRKKGLDYFPLDVDIFDDDKLFDVQNEYGPLGETVYLRLVCLIYKNGYYFKFDSIEKLAAMVIRSIGSRWVESKREIVEIIEFLIECGLFSKTLAKCNILTSKGIQTRFKLATERRRSGIMEYSLIDEGNVDIENVPDNYFAENNYCDDIYRPNDNTYVTDVTEDTQTSAIDTEFVSVYENSGFCSNNPTKKSKVNKSKVNKREEQKENISDTAVEKCLPMSALHKIVNIFNSICTSLPRVTKITAERIRAVKSAADKINGDFEGLFKRVEMSDFLTGRNGKWLNCSFDWIFKPCNLAKILGGNYDNCEIYPQKYSGFHHSNERDDENYYNSLKNLSLCY